MSTQRWQGRSPLEAFPVSIGLMGACAVLFGVTHLGLMGERGPSLIEWGMNYGVGFSRGQAWRPVTSIFLHANFIHIAFNLYAFWQLCPALERMIGSWRFAVIYFGAGLTGSVASLAFEPASLGASGAICGIMATYLRFERVSLGSFRAVWRDPVGQQFVVWLGLTVALGFTQVRISNAGHIGGIVGGWAFSAAVFPALRGMDRGRISSRPSAVKLAACIVLLAAAGLAVARPVWTSWYWAQRAVAASRAGDTPRALELVDKARQARWGKDGAACFALGLEEQQAGRDAVAEALYRLSEDTGFDDTALGHNLAMLLAKRGDTAALLAHLRNWKARGIPIPEFEDTLRTLEQLEKDKEKRDHPR